MSNGSEGRKISQFVQQNSVPAGSYFSFIYNGTNFKILDSDFYGSLGVTGTIVQKGDPLGTPVLNTAGTVNEIRNIEDGPGVKSSVSPQGGVTLEHNFATDTNGVPVFFDITENQPRFRSIQAGNGIGVTSTNGTILITNTETPVSNKTVVVNQLSDLPGAVGGVRTLEDNREYLLANDIDIGTDELVLGSNTAFKGTESTLITLTSSGTGDLFTMSNSVNRISNLRIDHPNGRVLNWSSTTSDIFRMNDVTVVECDKFAVLDATGGSAILRFTNVSPANINTDGLEFIGNFRSFYWNVSSFGINAGDMFNLGTATFDSFILDTALCGIGVGANLISGQSGSANINAGGSGLVAIMRGGGNGLPLSGVTTKDARWEFSENDDLEDSRTVGAMGLSGNATDTVLSTGVYVQIAGTQIDSDVNSRAFVNGSEQLEFTNPRSESGSAVVSMNAQRSGSGTNNYLFALFKNGSIVELSAGSPIVRNVEIGAIDASVTFVAPVSYTEGDQFDIRINRQGGTADLLISDMVLEIA